MDDKFHIPKTELCESCDIGTSYLQSITVIYENRSYKILLVCVYECNSCGKVSLSEYSEMEESQ